MLAVFCLERGLGRPLLISETPRHLGDRTVEVGDSSESQVSTDSHPLFSVMSSLA